MFCLYPWAELLDDERSTAQALRVLDQCRIRWGRVIADTGEQVVVESRPLMWDGTRLALGSPRQETAIRGFDGVDLIDPLAPGDWVSLHWGWVCDRLTPAQLVALRHYSAHPPAAGERPVGSTARRARGDVGAEDPMTVRLADDAG